MSHDIIFGETNRDWSCGSLPERKHVETIVLLRHGEKPPDGLGQLSRQGLARSLALPAVLGSKFGKPGFIFAPNPQQQKEDQGQPYDYVRPLATIEPTAIRFGMPVNTQFGFKNIDRLMIELLQPRYQDSLIFIAWEHKLAERLARKLLALDTTSQDSIPKWDDSNFDSLYIIQISQQGKQIRTSFMVDRQGLDNQDLSRPIPSNGQTSLAGVTLGTILGLALSMHIRRETTWHPANNNF